MFTTESLSIDDFRQAFRDGVITKRPYADLEEGSMYDVIGGTSALIWSRLTQRDTDVFADTQTDSAVGAALTNRLSSIFGIQRGLFSPGTGQIVLDRPSVGTQDDTIWKGTTIELVSLGEGVVLKSYVTTADVPLPTATKHVTVPVAATDIGPAVTALSSDSVYPRLADTLQDGTWTVTALTCAAGAPYEEAGSSKARARKAVQDQRLAHELAIIQACKKSGATDVVLFPSNYGGDANDFGLNMVYVGGIRFGLVAVCALALDKVRALGDCMQICPIVTQNLSLSVTVNLYDSPSKINQPALVQRLQNYLISAMRNDYSYSLDNFRGALLKASPLVQDATFTLPATDGTVMTTVNGALNFPSSLTRYILKPGNMAITLKGPHV